MTTDKDFETWFAKVRQFEWDESKCLANVAKHGIDFVDAMEAFFDPDCLFMISAAISRKTICMHRHGPTHRYSRSLHAAHREHSDHFCKNGPSH